MILNAVQFITLFLVYGYFQSFGNSGFIVGVPLGLMLIFRRNWWSALCVMAYLSSLFFDNEHLRFLGFISLLSVHCFISSSDSELTSVKFAPYEEEIRQYLFKTDPSVLHKVDGWLKKYKGKESELLSKVKAKYGNNVLASPLQSPSFPSPTIQNPTSTKRQGFVFSAKNDNSFADVPVSRLTPPQPQFPSNQMRTSELPRYPVQTPNSSINTSSTFSYSSYPNNNWNGPLDRSSTIGSKGPFRF